MRLNFVAPLMPTLVEKPPEGDGWIHEVKFDGYRSQMIIDEDGTRIFTRNGHNWTAKYRDLVTEAKSLGAESAIIDGEIIVLNEAGLSDFAELRKAITRRQHDLYFVAFDLLHLNGHDLRDMVLEERREVLASMIEPGGRIQFSESLPGPAKAILHACRPSRPRGYGVQAARQQISQRPFRKLAESGSIRSTNMSCWGWSGRPASQPLHH
ncbi:DNA ligase [Mesorhizobium australicum]|uniref:ATP-dependent DNA ligase n=1 Tax=Mesorhizobium australicum TaxID=536018 RepID=UPI003EB9E0C4